MAEDRALVGVKVLVVEDEALVAMMLEDMLADLGCEVVGPFAQIAKARAHVEADAGRIDVALLDVNVAGERSFALAELLAARHTPVLFATGYDDGGLEARWREAPRLAKPFTSGQLAAGLRLALG